MGIKEDRENFFKRFGAYLKTKIVGDDIFYANEIAANYLVTIIMWFLIVIELLTIVLASAGVYDVDPKSIVAPTAFTLVQMLVVIFLNYMYKGDKHWLKYLLMFVLCVTMAVIDAMFGFRVAIVLTLPVVLSTRYLQDSYTKVIAWISGIFILTSSIGYAFFGITADLEALPIAPGTVITIETDIYEAVEALGGYDMKQYLINILIRQYLPTILLFIVIAKVCVSVAKWGHFTVVSQNQVTQEYARIDTELNLATDIQANMQPNIIPALPEYDEFDVYATMHPAKEVGGDFYDYFMINDRTLAVVIADVSGKGVPAALFMVIAKTLIKNYAQLGMSPKQVFEKVNEVLCDGNKAELFVTAWMGYFNLESGKLTYVNAGHNCPIVKKADGEFREIKGRCGFVLAGMEDMMYAEKSMTLQEGDRLFIYTDGVTEATASDRQMYGTDRLLDYLNRHANDSQPDMLAGIKEELDHFQDVQFDDVTMLMLDVRKLDKGEL